MTHEKNMIDYLDWIEDENFSRHTDEYPSTMEEARKFRYGICQKDFLKSALQLGDFIPTNEKGEVMEKPKTLYISTAQPPSEHESFQHDKRVNEWKQALSRVLWKGWDIGKHGWVVNEFADSIGLVNGSKFVLDSDKTTYNDLITSGVKLERIEKK